MTMTDTPPRDASVVSQKILGFRPLYRQVREMLVKRIADGVWRAGQLLPSEPEIAADLGVSQGTVRKALDELTSEHIVVRRQGRGTYVALPDDARILCKFFRLTPDEGERCFPSSEILGIASTIDEGASERLEIPAREPVLTLTRLRLLDGARIFERIYLRASTFAGLDRREIPNNLYNFYSREFGITIGRAREHLKAIAASRTQAEHLAANVGDPLLQIDRLAFSLDDRPVEWRVSACRTDAIHYVSDLG
jgi:GntR family transcriptional regulator